MRTTLRSFVVALALCSTIFVACGGPTSPTQVHLQPNSATVQTGQSLQLALFGGTPPCTWKVEPASAGDIAGTDCISNFVGQTPGACQVTATDKNGKSDTGTVMVIGNPITQSSITIKSFTPDSGSSVPYGQSAISVSFDYAIKKGALDGLTGTYLETTVYLSVDGQEVIRASGSGNIIAKTDGVRGSGTTKASLPVQYAGQISQTNWLIAKIELVSGSPTGGIWLEIASGAPVAAVYKFFMP